MALTYNDLFILNLFSNSQAKKGSTVFHILQGKRTASILYRAVDYSLEPFFGFFPKLDRSTFYNILEELTSLGYLSHLQENNEYLQTRMAEDSVQSYLSNHYQPRDLNWLKQGRAVQDIQRKIYFLTQIFSEIRHENKRYLPVEKDYDIQQWAKKWIAKQETALPELAVEFGMEWKRLLSSLETENAVILVHLMSGHNVVGLTKNQLAQQMNLPRLEITLRQYDSMCYLIKQMNDVYKQVPLFASVAQEATILNESGVSNSAKETAVLLKKGFSIEKIIRIRQLKKSTISEHLIELVILFPTIEIQQFIPDEIYLSLKKLLTDFPEASFQELSDRLPNLEFWWYRLAQIERRRENEGKD
ncbi:helix-turn-helix domain-containing protein [Desemzia sp. RIT804]|uniref:helix-turn-helix domain-containing protein n=1 Tax=Desemzia sp. RIT 804 TaxID=2810209 RepID=UPI001951423C|nr:helix-turn-helix domain-containing protein [Desemzia sp. RIT 804]MBM6613717.1 helix-turn-helix domain-containing protein [Desemzia sp. RIT 804]